VELLTFLPQILLGHRLDCLYGNDRVIVVEPSNLGSIIIAEQPASLDGGKYAVEVEMVLAFEVIIAVRLVRQVRGITIEEG